MRSKIKKNVVRALHFLRAAGAARALHFSAAAGAGAAYRAKPGDGRALKLFFARAAFGACWKCSYGTNVLRNFFQRAMVLTVGFARCCVYTWL